MGVKGVKICREGLSRAEALMLEGGLREMVRALIADYNHKIGDAVLYYTECLGFWVLFGKREDGSDRRIASGYASVESLAALVERLEEEMRGVEDVEKRGVEDIATAARRVDVLAKGEDSAPYKKERIMV